MPSVIVVDDSPVDQRLAGALLEKHFDCAVRYAAHGKEALQLLEAEVPDLVLTDLQMPEMDGLELVSAVKNDYPYVPVILMTAKGSEEIAAQALLRGAASYVPKRQLAHDLAQTVQRVLMGAQEDRAHSRLLHYLETGEQTFVLPNDLSLVSALVIHVQQLLRCLPLADETERLRVGLALEEALRNAYYHGNLEVNKLAARGDRRAYDAAARQRLAEPAYRDRRIHVRARICRDEAVFVVRDEGPGFDFVVLPGPGALPDADAGQHRGVVLMHAIMDEVHYNETGNEVTLIKRRAPAAEPGSEPAVSAT